MTDSDPDFEHSDEGDHYPFPILSWLAVFLVIALIINPALFFANEPDPDKKKAPDGEKRLLKTRSLAAEALLVKITWGMQIVGQTPPETVITQLEVLDKKDNLERIALAMVEAILITPKAAQERLEKISPQVKETALEKPFTIVMDWVKRLGKDPKATIEDGPREDLASQLGWFATIPGNLPPPANDPQFWTADPKSFYGEMIRYAIRISIVFLMVVGLLIGGTILLVVFAVKSSRGPLGPGLAEHPDGAALSGILMQTFAIWFVGYFATSYLFGALVIPRTGMNGLAAAVLIQVLSLGVAFWPVYRGVPFQTLLEQIGLGKNFGSPREIFLGIISTISFWPVLIFLAFFTAVLVQSVPGADYPEHPLSAKMTTASRTDWILGFIAAGIMAPIVEEIFFRGFLYRHLRETANDAGPGMAVLLSLGISSVVFAIIHPQGLMGLPVLGGLGAFFGLLREVRNNLTASIAAHSMINCTTLFFLTFL